MTKDEALKLAMDWYGSGNQDPDEFERLILFIVAQPEHIGFMDSKLNPIQRTWVGLTDEEKDGKRVLENGLLFNTAEVQVWELAVQWAEEKLKERNA
jgi:hypothetical protein